MIFGSLFSGIGGLDLGLERARMTCAWQCEIDPYCRRVLEKHWPDVPRFGDIREMEDVPSVDLICGGTPCQPVSLAGKRRGQDDERWLWPEFARVLRMVRPRFALLENVPGILSRGMGDVLGDLAELGYDAEWGVLSAAQMGAPHLRRRVFVVAYSDRKRELQPQGCQQDERGRIGDGSQPMADTAGVHAQRWLHGSRQEQPRRSNWWSAEPDVGRVAHGVPARVDRLRALGNAVVPQVAEWIGRRIMEAAR